MPLKRGRIELKGEIPRAAIEEVTRKLYDLNRKLAKKAVTAGINDITKVVAKDAKKGVPRGSGLLRKSIGRKIERHKFGLIIVGVVGPRSGFAIVVNGKRRNPAKYAHLVEKGRAEVVPRKARFLADKAERVVFGVKVKMVPPHPFLRPAWDNNRRKAPAMMAVRVNEQMRAALKK